MPTHSLDVLGRIDPVVPEIVAARASAWLPGDVPVLPTRSGSVVLLRDGGAGVEVYLLHRHARMAFAASMVAFPGGGMSASDQDGGGDPVRKCAARETLEETGVSLRPEDLHEWAHWTTPEVEPRRFDTRFYVAVLPAGSIARDISGETDRAEWATPAAALTAAERGEITLMPPTLSILTELADAGSVADVVDRARERVVEPVLPRLERSAAGWRFVYPTRTSEPDGLPAYVRRVLAPNPGPMTLDGTNTWVVGNPGEAAPIVVDPGPADRVHLERILALCGGSVGTILLTHWHHDHSDGAAELARLAGCQVRAADPRFRTGPDGLDDGATVEAAGASLTAYATPGHTADSVCLLLRGTDRPARLLTGDTVLGRGTTVIMHPDGNLADYFRSLHRLQQLVQAESVRELLPGHGPVVTDPGGWLEFYRRHRLERLDQVRAAVAAGDRTPGEVVARVYADVDRSVRSAAERSVTAQLEFLAAESAPSDS